MPDTKPATVERPLSPHLSIYRWKLHMVLSILHRATGTALSLSTPVLVAWLWSAAYSPECFAAITEFFKTPIGSLLLIGWSFGFYLHLANGIRHLIWDMGKGFELDTVTRTGVIVVLFAVIFTAVTWIYALQGFNAPMVTSKNSAAETGHE